ncbi:unnamed protein product [Allacma fusca]|uniref:Calponin-homology (CH) domain-containing protein n=1 Tax=Allacma fusca TaxID=39272 RepID=A0A8J2NYA1_9HEXA|nr:unnamed protein product [Allacma fusca]
MSDHHLEVDELYAWIDSIPLSRPKRNIARDFADGVLVAEVVSHFYPKQVDLHNYPAASSLVQRKVNWQTLNRKVLIKIGVRISDDTIQQLMDAKPGVIEQVLREIRNTIEMNRTGKTQYRRTSSPTQNNLIPTKPTKSGKISTPSTHQRFSHLNNAGSLNDFKYNHNDAVNANQEDKFNVRCGVESHSPDCPTPNFNGSNRTNNQGYVAPPPPIQQASKGSIRSVVSRSGVKTAVSEKLDEPPAQIIYRGHKMVPLQLLDEKEKEMKNLETTNRSLTLKIFRLETLVNIKDQRVEDLTHQLQSLRSMYERVTDKTLKGIQPQPQP